MHITSQHEAQLFSAHKLSLSELEGRSCRFGTSIDGTVSILSLSTLWQLILIYRFLSHFSTVICRKVQFLNNARVELFQCLSWKQIHCKIPCFRHFEVHKKTLSDAFSHRNQFNIFFIRLMHRSKFFHCDEISRTVGLLVALCKVEKSNETANLTTFSPLPEHKRRWQRKNERIERNGKSMMKCITVAEDKEFFFKYFTPMFSFISCLANFPLQ